MAGSAGGVRDGGGWDGCSSNSTAAVVIVDEALLRTGLAEAAAEGVGKAETGMANAWKHAIERLPVPLWRT